MLAKEFESQFLKFSDTLTIHVGNRELKYQFDSSVWVVTRLYASLDSDLVRVEVRATNLVNHMWFGRAPGAVTLVPA